MSHKLIWNKSDIGLGLVVGYVIYSEGIFLFDDKRCCTLLDLLQCDSLDSVSFCLWCTRANIHLRSFSLWVPLYFILPPIVPDPTPLPLYKHFPMLENQYSTYVRLLDLFLVFGFDDWIKIGHPPPLHSFLGLIFIYLQALLYFSHKGFLPKYHWKEDLRSWYVSFIDSEYRVTPVTSESLGYNSHYFTIGQLH